MKRLLPLLFTLFMFIGIHSARSESTLGFCSDPTPVEEKVAAYRAQINIQFEGRQQNLADLQAKKAEAQAAIDKAKRAEALAQEYQDQQALPIAQQAISVAQNTLAKINAQITGEQSALGNDIDQEISELEEQTQQDKKALKNFKTQLHHFTDAIEEWGEMAKQARDDAYEKSAAFALDSFLLGLGNKENSLKQLETLTENQINQAKKLLKRENLSNAEIFKTIQEAGLPGDLKDLRKEKHFAEKIRKWIKKSHLEEGKNAQDTYGIINSDNKELEAIKVILSAMDPRIALAFSSGEYGIALAYAYKVKQHGEAQVDALLNLSDTQLQAVSCLSQTYMKHIQELNILNSRRKTF